MSRDPRIWRTAPTTLACTDPSAARRAAEAPSRKLIEKGRKATEGAATAALDITLYRENLETGPGRSR